MNTHFKEEKMKKLFTFIAALLMIVSLAACTTTKKDITITLAQGKPEIDAALKAYAATYKTKTGVTVNIVSCGGDSCQLGTQLRSDYQAGKMPDIFQIQGIEDYNEWKTIVAPLDGQDWVKDTDVSFKVDGKVVGFPVSIEGWGLAYNKDLLVKAGIDPTTLTSYDAYVAAFKKLDGMKKELGIDSVVSMAAGSNMYWVTADHNFNSLLSNGLKYGDLSVVTKLLAGTVDATRLTEYANWVKLLFDYANPTVLLTGGYAEQVGAFTNQKSVFIHQGNWIDGDLAKANAKFNIGIAPQGSTKAATDGIFVAAPSWYVVNKDSKNLKAAQAFLSAFVYTTEGNDYIVNKAGMIPAFKNITLTPTGQMSKSVQAWAKAGKIYSWNQYSFTGDFRSTKLGPIYNQLASKKITVEKFIQLVTDAFIANKK